MVKEFEKLSADEKQLLYKAPALVSVLASGSYDQKDMDKSQKADAIKLSHLKSYTAMPELRAYYEDVEKNFNVEFEKAIQKYFPFNEAKRYELKKELDKVSAVIRKLDKNFGDALSLSFERYAKHVKRAAHSVFQDFIFPMPIEGLSFRK
jgi:hypothetical protein